MKLSRDIPGETRPDHKSLRAKRILLAIVTVLVLLTAFLVYRVSTTMARMQRLETINRQLARFDEVLQDLLHAETGQRGYLLTGRGPYLEPYRAAMSRLPVNLRLLREEDLPDTVVHERFVRLDKLIDLKLAELKETLQLFDHGKPEQAVTLVQSDLGRLYMDEARTVIREMSVVLLGERSTLSMQIAQAAARLRLLLVAGAVALLMFVAMGVWTVWRTLNVNTGLLLRLAEEATHDVLTGLPNRRYLGEWLTQNMAVAARGNTTVGVFFLDLDGFKAINDRSGHDAGDRVLRAVADVMRDMLRQSDFAARLGGDEFAVVTIDRVGDSSLVRLGERLIAAISSLDLTPDALPGSLGASIGIAVFPGDGDTAEKLIEVADGAMYTAKRRGKGQVRLASDGQVAGRVVRSA